VAGGEQLSTWRGVRGGGGELRHDPGPVGVGRGR
jgi:hypothetical protein